MLVYDVTNRESFEEIPKWVEESEKYAAENTIRIFVGSKCDVVGKRKVSFEEGKELADHYNVKFLEASAKSDIGVGDLFRTLAKEVRTHILPQPVVKRKGMTMGAKQGMRRA